MESPTSNVIVCQGENRFSCKERYYAGFPKVGRRIRDPPRRNRMLLRRSWQTWERAGLLSESASPLSARIMLASDVVLNFLTVT